MSSSAYADEPPPPYAESDSLPQQQSASRPCSSQPAQLPRTHAVCIRHNTCRAEISYPSEWAPSRHVPAQDWAMFVAQLIPESAPGDSARDSKGLSYERKRTIEAVIRQWNEEYFQPRGVKITLDGSSQSQPGASSNTPGVYGHAGSSSEHQSQQPFPEQLPPRPAGQGPRRYLSTRERLTSKLKQVAKDNDITVSQQRFRVGQVLTVDAGKIQIGRLNVDDRGVQYGGRPVGPQFPPGYLGQAIRPQAQPVAQMASSAHHGVGSPSSSYPGSQQYGSHGHSSHGQFGGSGNMASQSPSSMSWSGGHGPPYQGQPSQNQQEDFMPPPGPPPSQSKADFGRPH